MPWTRTDQKFFDKYYEEYRRKRVKLKKEKERLTQQVHDWFEKEMGQYLDDPDYVDPKGGSATRGGKPSRGWQMRQLKIRRKIKLGDALKPELEASRLWDALIKFGSDMANDRINPLVHPGPFATPKQIETAKKKIETQTKSKRNSKIYEIEVTKWKETASGHWRRAQNGVWPDWVDRIVIDLYELGKGGELRMFGWDRGSDIHCTINAEKLTLKRMQFPRGAANGIKLTENQLKGVMTDDYAKIKKHQRK